MTTFIEENPDFVLKLKIKAADGQTQIRRVRLPRIADSHGEVSYEELVGLVIVFTFPEKSTTGPSGYLVSLTYYDVDGDSVTIASTEELLDACEQYVGQKVLRITTYVKPRTTASGASPSSHSAAAKAAASSDNRKPPPPSADRGTSTRSETTTTPPIQIHDVLESFVGVLSTAVSHLQEGLAAPSPKNPRGSLPTSAKPEANGEESAKAPKKPEREAGIPADEDETKPAAEVVGEEETPKSETKDNHDENESDDDEDTEDKDEPRSFIHGRHTCDSCLATPIIGKRYHSTNLQDYDLCENCFHNYKGKEITFEVAELERDRAFQERWQRRWDRTQTVISRRGRFGGRGPRGFHGKRFGPGPKPRGRFADGHPAPPPPPPSHAAPPPPPHHGMPPPPPPHHNQGLPSPPPPHHPMGFGGFHHHWAHLGPHVAPHLHVPTNCLASEFDSALKEAIRRSLSDIGPKEAEINKKNESAAQPTAPVDPFPPPEEDSQELDSKKSGPGVEETKMVSPVVETSTVEVNDIPRSVEIVKSHDKSLQEYADGSKGEPYDLTFADADTEEIENSMETESVDSEKLAADAVEPVTKPQAKLRNFFDSSRDESFASDARGSGDVAEAMGAALDRVAGAISEMLAESDYVVQQDPPKNGELIIGSTDMAENDDNKDDESEWSVVKSVGSNGSSGTTESQKIAKAAEILGSALFHSDMKNSAENCASISRCGSEIGSSFSVPSSVPTDAGASHSPSAAQAQLDRWAVHLAQLSELGFDNESDCVEILERLAAANIGVDAENDDISLNHVINELCEKQNK